MTILAMEGFFAHRNIFFVMRKFIICIVIHSVMIFLFVSDIELILNKMLKLSMTLSVQEIMIAH